MTTLLLVKQEKSTTLGGNRPGSLERKEVVPDSGGNGNERTEPLSHPMSVSPWDQFHKQIHKAFQFCIYSGTSGH